LANINIARSRAAPKHILTDARTCNHGL
jgi:hypothetical protein